MDSLALPCSSAALARVQIRLGLYHRRLRLSHLLIQIRRLHLGQKLSGRYAVADVHIRRST